MALPHTNKHQSHIDTCADNFIECVKVHGNHLWDLLLQDVNFVGPNGVKKKAPKIFVELGGMKTPEKVQIANKAIVL